MLKVFSKNNIPLSREASKVASDKRKRIKRVIIASSVFAIVVAIFMAYTFSGVGIISEAVTGNIILDTDLSAVPQNVIDDAAKLATQLYGDSQQQYDIFIQQLIATYKEAQDKDFIILFNPGGWGGSTIINSPDWSSIIRGIDSDLQEWGYNSVVFNYQRTLNTLQARLNELKEQLLGYSTKSEELVNRINFITSHNKDVRVILAGESTGSVICDDTMKILKDNPMVFSIQTGSPFWHKDVTTIRTLRLNSNGVVPDSFSQGDFVTMLVASFKTLIGIVPTEGQEGKVLFFMEAPGHEYWWKYPGVGSNIEEFLSNIFKTKS